MYFINQLLFGYYPYVAGTVFLFGSLVRFDMSQYTWKTSSSQLLDSSPRFRLGNNLFHIGIIFLFFGHFVGLLMPHELYPWFGLTPHSKQILAIVSGGLFGLVCFVGMTILIVRRLSNVRVRAQSSRMDHFILLLLYVQLILGMMTILISKNHLDGSMMLLLTDWAQHIITFRGGAAELITAAPWIYRAHIFLGLTIFLVFPFTRLVHIWSAPLWYLGRSYQLVRQRQG